MDYFVACEPRLTALFLALTECVYIGRFVRVSLAPTMDEHRQMIHSKIVFGGFRKALADHGQRDFKGFLTHIAPEIKRFFFGNCRKV